MSMQWYYFRNEEKVGSVIKHKNPSEKSVFASNEGKKSPKNDTKSAVNVIAVLWGSSALWKVCGCIQQLLFRLFFSAVPW